jgi:hypothetical protein
MIGRLTLLVSIFSVLEVFGQQALDFSQAQSGADFTPAQYHIQTDLGKNRFFRFQTHSGQFRKEKLTADGSQVGSYGWVDPNGVLRLYDYIADSQGYRIERERLFKVGQSTSTGVTVQTRGGPLQLGFQVFPLDGDAGPSLANRVGGSGIESRIHIPEGDFQSTQGYQVSSLTSTNHHLDPNPLTKHAHATYFSGSPIAPPPPPPRRIVVGAEDTELEPAQPVQDGFVVGHAGSAPSPAPRSLPARTGIVIGLSNHDGGTSRSNALPAPRPVPRARNSVVIGSTRRRRFVLF